MSMSSLGSREFESCWGKLPDDLRRLRSHCSCQRSTAVVKVCPRVMSGLEALPQLWRTHRDNHSTTLWCLKIVPTCSQLCWISCIMRVLVSRVNLWMTLGRGEGMKGGGTHSLDVFHRQATSKRAGDWWSPPSVWAFSAPCSHSLEWSAPKSAGVKGSKPGLPAWRVWPSF